MFASMAIGNKSYIEPQSVLSQIIDESAIQIQIGDERDLREFNEIFLSRISDAVKAVQSRLPYTNIFSSNARQESSNKN